MRYLRENTATRITVGPFLDVADGITPEVALTVTACHLTFMVDDAGVPTLVIDAAPTASAGSNDMVHVTSDIAGFYDLELTAAQTNYTGRAMLMIHDTDVHLPVFHEFQIVSANVYDSLFTDGDVLDVNVVQWLGTAAATPTTAGVPEVDVTHVSGTAQTANDIGADVNEILTDTGTTIPATIATAQADLDIITGTSGVVLDADAITAAKIADNAITADQLDATAVTEIWGHVCESVGSRTAQQILSIVLAAVAGVTADAGATIKDAAGTNTRISATINGSNERTAMTLTPSS